MYKVDAKKYGVVFFKLKVIKHRIIDNNFRKKSIETQLCSVKYLSYQIGDILELVNPVTKEKCSKVIVNIKIINKNSKNNSCIIYFEVL